MKDDIIVAVADTIQTRGCFVDIPACFSGHLRLRIEATEVGSGIHFCMHYVRRPWCLCQREVEAGSSILCGGGCYRYHVTHGINFILVMVINLIIRNVQAFLSFDWV